MFILKGINSSQNIQQSRHSIELDKSVVGADGFIQHLIKNMCFAWH
jgi:hypothetical protein